MKKWWPSNRRRDSEGIDRAVRQRREAEQLAARLKAHRQENHFGEKFHAALRLKGNI